MSTCHVSRTFAVAPQACRDCAQVHVSAAHGAPRLRIVISDAEMRQRLGFAIRVALANKGWKPPDLARAIGVDASTVARWASGESVPNLFTVRALSEALDVDPDYIYDPSAVPAYPISLEGLVRRSTAEGLEEGLAPPKRRRAKRPADDAGSAA